MGVGRIYPVDAGAQTGGTPEVPMRLGFPLLMVLSAIPVQAVPPAAPPKPYLGQPFPGPEAVPFAPGLVNRGLSTRDLCWSPDGRELCFTVMLGGFSRAVLVGSRMEAGGWTAPELLPVARDGRYRTLEPHFAPDGRRFFFVSDRPAEGDAPGPEGIWVMERTGPGTGAWGEARRLPPPINGPRPSFFPSLTREGTLYFTRDEADGSSRIWRARPKGGGWADPELLPAQVNSGRSRFNAWISPEEDLLILGVFGRPDSLGGTDHYGVFRRPDDTWSEPLNLGPAINSPAGEEYSASLSPDGKWLFFMSPRRSGREPKRLDLATVETLARTPGQNGLPAVHWVDAGFLAALRQRAVFPAR